MGNEHKDGTDGKAAPKHPEPLTGLYQNDHMKGLVLNKMNYGSTPTDTATCAAGPKLTDLKIDVPHVTQPGSPVSVENYQKIAEKGTEFIAINGNINLDVKHALDEARQTDKADKTGHKNVDQLLGYMNKNLCGTYFSVARHNDTFMLIDSRDNKPDAHGKFNVHPREKWNMATKKYED